MDIIVVGLAGFLGAITRALIANMDFFRQYKFPIGTLIINLTGSLILSLFLKLTLERFPVNPKLRLAISTGFLGAYTTFSTFAVETVTLLKDGNWLYAFIYVVASTIGGLLFAWLGLMVASYFGRKKFE